MFTTRIIDFKEKDRYNSFVQTHSKGDFLQTWDWGESERRRGWQPLPLILEKDGKIEASLLILKRKLRLPLINRCIFYAPRGPVVDVENEELCQALFTGAERVARDHKAVFIKINPDVPASNERFINIISNCNFKKNNTGLNFFELELGSDVNINSRNGLYCCKKVLDTHDKELVGDWDRVYSRAIYFVWTKVIYLYIKFRRSILKAGLNEL